MAGSQRGMAWALLSNSGCHKVDQAERSCSASASFRSRSKSSRLWQGSRLTSCSNFMANTGLWYGRRAALCGDVQNFMPFSGRRYGVQLGPQQSVLAAVSAAAKQLAVHAAWTRRLNTAKSTNLPPSYPRPTIG